MTTKVLIPKVGMGTDEGTVAKWLKKKGDRVLQGEIIAEIEFAKAIEELPAPATGVLTQLLLTEGQTAVVYTEIAIIEEGG
jgi:pyruvate/2-oxoglutarate dehydrogenase complex dihydrolipoamide acyltransferase (E2) component